MKIVKNLWDTFYSRWTLLSVLFMVVTIAMIANNATVLKFSVGNFAITFFFSLIFWNLLGAIIDRTPKMLSFLLRGVLALFLPFVFVTGIQLFLEFRLFLSKDLIGFIYGDMSYFSALMENYLFNFWIILGYLLAVALFFFLLVFRMRKKQTVWGIWLIMGLIIGVGQNQFGKYGTDYLTPMDISMFFAYKDFNSNKKTVLNNKNMLRISTHRILPKTGRENEYNIVLVLNESMGVNPFSLYGYENNYTPFLHEWWERESKQFAVFQDAMSISGATDMSVPTMMTGVGPERSYEDFMTHPFLWDFAKVNDYHTYYVTSQSINWKNFRYFFKNEQLDVLFGAEESKENYINDLGIDDVKQARNAAKLIENTPDNERFFMIYNTNALHTPYQNESQELAIPKSIDKRYGKAMYIVDQSIRKVYDAIEKRGEIENTIFIFTSDHAHYKADRLPRIASFYKEVLHIPIWIRFPKKWIQENENDWKTLQGNQEKRITNLDLLPTVVEILKSTENNAEIMAHYTGKSLFEHIDNDRVVIALSTNDFRVWSQEGFGVYKDHFSYLVDNVSGGQFYDLKKDPHQAINQIKEMPSDWQEIVEDAIQKYPSIKRIQDLYFEVN